MTLDPIDIIPALFKIMNYSISLLFDVVLELLKTAKKDEFLSNCKYIYLNVHETINLN